MTMRSLRAALTILLLLPAVATAGPGDRDPTFSGNGFDTVISGIGFAYHIQMRDVAVDAANRTLIGGTKYDDDERYGLIVRYRAGGSRDDGFNGPGNNGELRAQGYDGNSELSLGGMFLDPADRLRGSFFGNSSAVVAGYLASGELDDQFGDGGVRPIPPLNGGQQAEDSAVGPDGSVYTTGPDTIYNTGGETALFATKVDPDGAYVGDYAAATTSIVIPRDSPPTAKHPIVGVVDAQGRLVIGTTARVDTERRFYLIRLTPDGALDTTFGTNGRATFPATKAGDPTRSNFDGSSYELHGLAIGPGNTVYATGAADGPTAGITAVTARFTAAGQVDNGFGVVEGGRARGATLSNYRLSHGDAVAVQQGAGAGKVIVAGEGFGGEVVLTRYTAAGVPDASFGPGGTGSLADELVSDAPVTIGGLATTPRGKLLVTGWLKFGEQTDDGFVARYLLTDPGNAPENLTPPGLTGTPRVGSPLNCAAGTWTNSPVVTVVWERAPRTTASDTDPAWAAIGGASGRTYTLAQDDLGSRVRCREVAANGDGSDTAPSESKRVDADVPANLRRPVATGIPIVGEKLTCDTGEWSNGPDLDVRWLRDGAVITDANAVGRVYQLTIEDRRHRVACRVGASNDIGRAAADADSDGLLAVLEAPAIQRKPVARSETVGARATDVRLTCADPGTWDEDYGSYEYRWQREGTEIAGATGQSYDASVDDLGRNLACVVFSTNPKGRSEGAASDDVLVPLPATVSYPGQIFKAGGFNQVDPTNLMAVSYSYLGVIRNLVTNRRAAAQTALRASCAAGPFKSEPLPDFNRAVGTRLGDRQTCAVLLADRLGFNVIQTENGSFWNNGPFACAVPGGVAPTGKGRCPQLRIDVPPLDPRKPLDTATAAEKAQLEANQPLFVLWDFDSDGRTDAACDAQAPILRSLYSRGIYRVRAVIVSRYSVETGQYDVIDTDLSHFPQSDAQRGAIRNGQPFACKTSLEPPPEPQLPCVSEVTFGRAHMTGNLCPISARRIPPSEFDGLPASVQQMLVDQALNGPLDRRRASLMPTTFGDTRVGGLPDDLATAASVASTQVSAVSTLDSATPARIADSWKDKLKDVKSFDLQQAQRAMDQIYVANGASTLNGVKLDPVGTATTVLVPSDAGAAIDGVKKLTVSSTNVATTLGGIPIGDPGRLATDLEDRIKADARAQVDTVLKGANLDTLKDSLKSKLDLGPFKLAGDAKVKLNNDGTATIDAWAELPKLLTKPGSKPIRVAVEVSASREGRLSLNGIHMTAPSAYLGGVHIADMALDYDGNGLSVKGKLLFPPLNAGIAINKFRLDDRGNFRELDVDYLAGAGQGIPLGYGLFMTKIGGGLSLDPDEVRARTAISVGPSAGGGCPTVGMEAQFTVHFSPDPFFVDATGTVGLLCIPLANAHFYADSTGLIDLSAGANIDIGPLFFSSTFHGRLQLPRWQIDYVGSGGIRGLLEADLKGLIGNLGIAACASLEIFPETPLTDAVEISGGAGVRFPGRPPLLFTELLANIRIFVGCDLGSWSPFGRSLRQAGGGGRTFDVDGRTPVLALELTGTGGAPRVTLTAPDGKVIDATRLGAQFTRTADVAGMTDAEHARTVLFVRGAKGRWTVTPAPGSPALADVRHAEVLPQPKVKATVGGAGASRVLRYRIAKVPGQVVTFVEQSPLGMRTVKTVKGGGRGRTRFLTSEGGGTKRTITAQVAQDGLPRENIVVARFRAPSPRAGRAPRLRLRRRGSRAVATWGKAAYTRGYEVVVATGDGGRRLLLPAKRRVTFGGLAKGEGATVTVTSLAPSGRRGGTATARLKGDRTFSSFKNKKRVKVKAKGRKRKKGKRS